MRFILVIPVLILFIGQVPFMKHMERTMTQRIQSHTSEKSCCSKKKEKKTACHKRDTEEKNKEKGCCQKPEARCACVCCFSIAPLTENATLAKHYDSNTDKKKITGKEKLLFQYYPVLTPPPDRVIVLTI